MIALIAKELRYYAGQRKFRRIQLIIIGLLSLILLISAFELFAYAQRGGQFNVGYGVYSILVIALFIMLLCLVVPLQAIEAAQIENLNSNIDLLRISPLSIWKQLAANSWRQLLQLSGQFGSSAPYSGSQSTAAV